ncbi:protein-glutamate O-methyltransferase CheR [Oscillatoria sp. FACHB-1407]|uniref:CheR family methyltransferase n=1 Tax=Oscillatoria sp. FACHB-1407 TaxID=2692847 RepID=UPI001684CD62|nr:protein-glutamate O-methyltransferase CheR [Oscillatoria sp. FACHB-1407]MBD2464439.1 protein-glutamate O-methyltransferase CheR [Oscillatoria sp. FACHB-1407]
MIAQINPPTSFLCDSPLARDDDSSGLETLLDYLKCNRECDLTGYKRSTLMRRFRHRMQQLNLYSYSNYLRFLQDCPNEHLALLDEVLINFTGFFRDRHTWEYLATEVIPSIVASKSSNEPIRVWSAGCATGQEVCSLLILLAEILGLEACLERVQFYATDADVHALQQARRGVYRETDVVHLPPQWLKKYFVRTCRGYVFHPTLRRIVTFKRHNLMQDAPLHDVNLLVCRNVLMYLTAEAQQSILGRFHASLEDKGFLFLGQAELLFHQRHLFRTVNLQQRFYTKALDSVW